MKITIRNRSFRAESQFDSLIEARLIALAERVRIDDASVTIERRAEASPPYSVQLHVAVPGPDLHAEYHGSTPHQAFNRALEEVERKLRERELKRIGRSRARAPRTSALRLSSPGRR